MQARTQEFLEVGSFSQRPKAAGGVWGRAPGSAAGEKFFGDRLGYPAISMNFKTESFTYVIFLIFTHFVISLTCNLLMIGQFHHYLVKGYNSGIF